ncbi:hypothetical protein MtrunA17_Chr5g0408411 [Medicago truncatula]|uniref:Transmembrane protein n=1 Tax=Medicago truncatula TaxID=3880 RepID=A0A396HRN5_MEDTR|nr:hypothetical protein MtrunA17_Chr5g0408411 [Medicago truncatula]
MYGITLFISNLQLLGFIAQLNLFICAGFHVLSNLMNFMFSLPLIPHQWFLICPGTIIKPIELFMI